jgi:hypothetical protein
MSSHHFVKEGQEPALFVLEPIEFLIVEPLLEWAPLVLISDTVLDLVLSWGIKVDGVVQHELTVTELEDAFKHQFPVKIIESRENIIGSGLNYISDNGHAAVNITGSAPEELFQAIANFGQNLQVNVLSGATKWSLVTSGSFGKWFDANQMVIIRTTPGSTLTTTGLEKAMGQQWRVISSGTIAIKSNRSFWVSEHILPS